MLDFVLRTLESCRIISAWLSVTVEAVFWVGRWCSSSQILGIRTVLIWILRSVWNGEQVVRFLGGVTMLASGGSGHIYPSTTNPLVRFLCYKQNGYYVLFFFGVWGECMSSTTKSDCPVLHESATRAPSLWMTFSNGEMSFRFWGIDNPLWHFWNNNHFIGLKSHLIGWQADVVDEWEL